MLLTLFSALHQMECQQLLKLPTNCAETPSSQLHIPLLLQKFQPWNMQQFSQAETPQTIPQGQSMLLCNSLLLSFILTQYFACN